MSRVRIDGNMYDFDEEITLEKNIKHTVEIVVDRLALRKDIRSRLTDSLETAPGPGTDGLADVDVIGGDCMTFQPELRLPGARHLHQGLSPRLFSLQQPLGCLRRTVRAWHLHEGRPSSASCATETCPSGRRHQGQRLVLRRGSVISRCTI